MGPQLQRIATNPLPPAASQLTDFPKPRDSGRDRAQVPLLPFHSVLLVQNPTNLQQQQIYGVQPLPEPST